LNPVGATFIPWPNLTDSKQGVDAHIVLRRRSFGESDTGVRRHFSGGCGINGHVAGVPQAGYDRILPPKLEVHCCFVSVTTVVPWPACYPDSLGVWCDRYGELCNGKTSALHKCVWRQM
jgi:hypothetical protein